MVAVLGDQVLDESGPLGVGQRIQRGMADHGADVETSTPEQLGSLVKTELAKWKNVVVKAKITMD